MAVGSGPGEGLTWQRGGRMLKRERGREARVQLPPTPSSGVLNFYPRTPASSPHRQGTAASLVSVSPAFIPFLGRPQTRSCPRTSHQLLPLYWRGHSCTSFRSVHGSPLQSGLPNHPVCQQLQLCHFPFPDLLYFSSELFFLFLFLSF